MKKGQLLYGMETVEVLAKIFFVIVIAVAIWFIVNSRVTRDIDIDILEGSLLFSRLYSSEDCFAYKDARIYVGMIDYNKFNENRLSKCLDSNINLRVKLINKGKEIYKNEDNFKELNKFCKFRNRFFCYEGFFPVLIKNADFNFDILNFKIVVDRNEMFK